jgi:Domain of unknown function (DUF3291)
MYFLSITRLRIRSLRYMPPFVFKTLRAVAQIRRSAGYLDGAVLRDRKRTFWTMTLWADQAAMRRYIASGDHLEVMPKLMAWCDEASIVHWFQPTGELPTWPNADARMRAEGRPSKVHNASANHLTLTFEPPRLSAATAIKPLANTLS